MRRPCSPRRPWRRPWPRPPACRTVPPASSASSSGPRHVLHDGGLLQPHGVELAGAALVAGALGGDGAVEGVGLALDGLGQPAQALGLLRLHLVGPGVELRRSPRPGCGPGGGPARSSAGDPLQEGAVVADDQGGGRAARDQARSSVSMATMSRWLVGSSSRIRSGSSAKASASAARRISPPDRPWVDLAGSRPKASQLGLRVPGLGPAGDGVVQHRLAVDHRLLRHEGDGRPGCRKRSPPSGSIAPAIRRIERGLARAVLARPGRRGPAGSSARSTPSNSMDGPSCRRTPLSATTGGTVLRAMSAR